MASAGPQPHCQRISPSRPDSEARFNHRDQPERAGPGSVSVTQAGTGSIRHLRVNHHDDLRSGLQVGQDPHRDREELANRRAARPGKYDASPPPQMSVRGGEGAEVRLAHRTKRTRQGRGRGSRITRIRSPRRRRRIPNRPPAAAPSSAAAAAAENRQAAAE